MSDDHNNLAPESRPECTGRVVLLAMDGSEHSDYAFEWYMDKVYKEGDNVLFGHVVDFTTCLSYGGMSVVPGDPALLGNMIHEEEKKISKFVATLNEKLKIWKVDGKVLRLSGDPGEAIVGAAKAKKVDFIVTGCRGLGSIRRTFLGSVSDYILHHSNVPVFVCRHTK